MHYDIIIIGSGIVGATAALALAKNSSLKIAVIETKFLSTTWQPEKHDYRVSAISLASQRIFQNLQIWNAIHNKRVSPYTQMQVWDAQGEGRIYFDCNDVGESALGYIIEDSVMRTSLLEEMHKQANIQFHSPVKLTSLSEKLTHVELATEDKQIFTTNLVVAADGAYSWVREQANIELRTCEYNHTAIVALVGTSLVHQMTARQRFLPTGPLAFLPLSDKNTCSIVWSVTPEYAEKLLSLSDEVFREVLGEAFAHTLGDITSVSERYHFPLHMRHAKNYVQQRLALIGDAAHTIHPLAGLGVNMGLLDAACLAETIHAALAKSRDFSSLATLRHYERWRKSDNFVMLAAVDLLKRMFASEKKSLETVRNLGLNLTNHLPFMKNFLTNYALGNRTDMPEMAKPSASFCF